MRRLGSLRCNLASEKKRPEVDIPADLMNEAVRAILAGDCTITECAAEIGAPTHQVSRWVREERARRAAEREAKRAARCLEPAAALGEIFAPLRPGDALPIDVVVREVSRLPEGLVEIWAEGELLRLDTQTILQALAPRRWASEMSACVERHERAVGWILRVDWTVTALRMRGGLRLISRSPFGRNGLMRSVSAVVRLGGD